MFENTLLYNQILIIISVLIILVGLIMFFAPTEFDKWTNTMDKVIGLFDVKILSNRIIWGIVLFISSAFLFYTAYSL